MTPAALVAALGLVLAAEGLLYALFPGLVRGALAWLVALPETRLRAIGLAAAGLGALTAFAAGAL
ncbi:DUF2065 family protein [Elioraea sp.]|jgi:uncharacterized protein YjeT (DUF2065 family)|uniref:DUF2065 family protein n=1 Tax=Elioraea sp. TaxID=2185103 RepID=UPI0021DCFCB4|nr:DUF2065 family protein [Elioraea sp.]GIX10459.1 MAG: hypothetical protein KatS3mg116_2169 [Elioraea sp.]